VWFIYNFHKSNILKARDLQNITKTLTMCRFWTDVQVTIQTEAQWVQNAQRTKYLLAHCAQRNEVLLVHNAQNAGLWDKIPAHILIHVGGIILSWELVQKWVRGRQEP
jgi:hypothetical protein